MRLLSAAACLLLLCCAACRPQPAASQSPHYLDPANVALRQQALARLQWDSLPDYEQAFELYMQAARNGDGLAKLAASLVRGTYLDDNSYLETDYVHLRLLPAIRSRADAGNAEAAWLVGWYGLWMKDLDLPALDYLKQAAAAGRPEACYWLGWAKRDGRLCAKDALEAMHWFELGAQAGSVECRYQVANMLALRNYPKYDPMRSYALYQELADSGCISAYYALGYASENGIGTPPDFKQALAWYEKSSAAGDAQGSEMLGYLHYEGRGVERSMAAARRYYQLAADQGSYNAEKWVRYLDRNPEG